MNKREIEKYKRINKKFKTAIEKTRVSVHELGDYLIKYATEYLPHYQAGFKAGVLQERRRVRKAKKKARK